MISMGSIYFRQTSVLIILPSSHLETEMRSSPLFCRLADLSEDFMDNLKFVNDFKLRAGWGQKGNQEGMGSYAYLPLSNITVSNDCTPMGQ